MMTVRNLDFSYQHNRPVFEKITFDVQAGECIAILGNNGAGKSTMLKCLNRILTPSGGVVTVEAAAVNEMGRKEIARHLAFVAQDNERTRMTVREAVALGRIPFIRFTMTAEDDAIVKAVLEEMHLKDFELRYLDELSGGELQKVMIARALAQQPRVLLLDEPTSSLDMRNQLEVLALIRNVCTRRNIAVIMVIHDLNMALRCCDRFLFLKDGGIYAYGGEEIMTRQCIEAVYQMPVCMGMVGGHKLIVPQ